jgi:parvulin-like peptidyl-prolyl isomerase
MSMSRERENDHLDHSNSSLVPRGSQLSDEFQIQDVDLPTPQTFELQRLRLLNQMTPEDRKRYLENERLRLLTPEDRKRYLENEAEDRKNERLRLLNQMTPEDRKRYLENERASQGPQVAMIFPAL